MTDKQVTLGMFEEDDEFEEFPVEGISFPFLTDTNYMTDWQEGAENKLDVEQWEADWDDDNLDDDFSKQLRTELERMEATNAK
jgi:26 proteasome complex subunit DSS1